MHVDRAENVAMVDRAIPRWRLLSACLLSFALADAAAATGPTGRTPVIVNQAADAIVGYMKIEKPLGEGATREMAVRALEQVVDQYQGTGVECVFWNVCYQRAAYRSEAWSSYWDVDQPETTTTGWPRRYYQLHKLGIDDAFAILFARCRQRGISPWASVRMNDTHYIDDPAKVSRLWREHPEMRIHERGGLDFMHPEVRQHAMKLLDELLARYDLDGVELDWMRFPFHFKPGEHERGREVLTQWMREARAKTAAASRRLGHPVRIAVRVPATPEFARGLGMDAVAWTRAGLVDLLIPCSLWKPSFADIPIERWREEIGPDAPGYRIMAGTDLWIRGASRGRFMQSDMDTLGGFTLAMLDRGADGIYLFNHFQPTDARLWYRTPDGQRKSDFLTADQLRLASDREAAARRPRRHVLTFHDPVPKESDYRAPLPAPVESGKPATLPIYSGPRPTSGRYVVRVGLEEAEDLDTATLGVRLNGAACRVIGDLPRPAKQDPRPDQPRQNVCEVAPRVVEFAAPPEAVRRGYNDVELTVERGGPQTVVWLEVFVEP